MEENLKEVRYDLYCHTCLYEKIPEDEAPCRYCLSEPSRYSSHKPFWWKGKKGYEQYVAPEHPEEEIKEEIKEDLKRDISSRIRRKRK